MTKKYLSVSDLESLLETNPKELLSILENESQPNHVLTFAAEIMGNCNSEMYPEVIPVLKTLLNHSSSVVREGAIYGLACAIPSVPSVTEIIRAHTTELEPSIGVRKAASGALE